VLLDTAVRKHDGAAAILAFGNSALEVAVVERMVFHLDGKTLVGGIERWALRDCPGLEDGVELEAQIVVRRGAACFWMTTRGYSGARIFALPLLGRLPEIPLGLKAGELLLRHRYAPG
jgi:hypothetical protein